MIYASIDIETSGLDPEVNSILSIGVIVEDTDKKLGFEEIPKLKINVLQRQIIGSPRAITMNRDLIAVIGEYLDGPKEMKPIFEETQHAKFLEPIDVVPALFDFLFLNGHGYDLYPSITIRRADGNILPALGSITKPVTINVAGKNFGTFDKLFLEKLPRWKQLIKVRQRVIDPSVLFCDWKNDETLPSLKICKERSGVSGDVAHDAIEDAWDVIQLLRKFY